MKEKAAKPRAGKTSAKKKARTTHEYETMSQQQNRYGKGRQHNGSDGGSNEGQGANH